MESKLYKKGFTQLMSEVQKDPAILKLAMIDYVSLGHRCEALEAALKQQSPVGFKPQTRDPELEEAKARLEATMKELSRVQNELSQARAAGTQGQTV